MAELSYYAQRRVVDNGQPVANQNSLQFGTRRWVERQYCLFRANALEGEIQQYEKIQIEWGTLENGYKERIVYLRDPIPESEPEEPEVENGET